MTSFFQHAGFGPAFFWLRRHESGLTRVRPKHKNALAISFHHRFHLDRVLQQDSPLIARAVIKQILEVSVWRSTVNSYNI
jgi:hypothetical protein